MIPDMPRNYSDNVTEPESLTVTLWTEDMILKRFIDLSGKNFTPIRLSPSDPGRMRLLGGTYRQEMAHRFNNIVYPRRQIVENKFSVLKRKFSGDLKARRFLIQKKEIANKMIVCNIHRFLQFFLVKVFYRAIFFAIYFAPGFDPGAAATTLSASTISGRISAGMPMTISPSSMPENFREPSQPSEKLTLPLR